MLGGHLAIDSVVDSILESQDHQAEIFGRFFLTKTKAELIRDALDKSLILSPVYDVQDVVECPQLASRDYFLQVEHPELGGLVTYPGPPVKLSEMPWRVWRRPPLVGEHNSAIYEEELGLSPEQLALLKARGVI